MDEVVRVMSRGENVAEQQVLAMAAAEEFANRNVKDCQSIGSHGADLIRPGARILTHCNAGWLAFVDFGSATAPLYVAQAQGREFHVLCDETRPRCQGATLTAWELAQQGISHEIIADNAAGHLMQRGEIDLVIVGSDRTLGRTGEVANKIGTYTKGVLAARHKVPFYVAIPLSTLDWRLKSGKAIPIEERSPEEVLGMMGVASPGPGTGSRRPRSRRNYSEAGRDAVTWFRVANPTSSARNPGFDVTPPDLITGIITPVGIFKPAELWENRSRLGFS
jgi:methylthioribose-1-phosphate isomerase